MTNEVDYTNLTDGQEIAMSVLYVLSSSLSIIGSSAIVYKVISDRCHATSYDRLMLGLSVCDIVASVGFALTPFLLPGETSPRVWAMGSDSSCTFVGFLTQLGFSAVLYNGFLSYYFLLTIRYGTKRQKFATRYEPWIHFFVFIFAFGTALVGAAMGFFTEVQVGMGCWVNDYPRGCYEDCLSEEIGWVYGSVPVFFTLLSLIVNNVLVYLHVRKVFRATEIVETSRLQRQKIQKREVAAQGLYYVGSFLFCYWPAIAVRVIEAFSYKSVDEGKIYWLLMIQASTLPLQGFMNMFIYNRPNYKRVRAAYPELSLLTAIRMACLDSKIPKLSAISAGIASQTSNRKFKNRDRSGKSFSSDLEKIQEEIEENDSDSYGSLDNDPTYEQWRSAGVNICNDAQEGNDDYVSPPDHNVALDGLGESPGIDEKGMETGSQSDFRPKHHGSSRRIEMDGSLTDLGENISA